MTRIYPGISLLSVETGSEFHGVYLVQDNDTFLCTSKKSTAVFKAPDPKPIQSWMNKPSAAFSCPVVFDQAKDEYLAVVNQKQIYKWSSDDTAPFKRKAQTLKNPAYRIFVSGECRILLMTDGTLRTLETPSVPLKGVQASPLSDGEEICDAWLWERNGEKDSTAASHIVCLVHSSKNKTDEVLMIPIPREDQEDDSVCDVIRLSLDNCGGHDLLSVSLHCDTSSALLYTLWEGGSVCLSVISDTMLRGKRTGEEKLACCQKFSVKGQEDSLKMSAIDDRHIALTGIHSVSTADKPEACLSIWEVSYGTLQAHLPLDDEVPSFLGKVKGHLLVASSKAVTLHRYECSSGTLASALGRLSGDQIDEDLPVLGIDWSQGKASPQKKTEGKKSKAKVQQSPTWSEETMSTLLADVLHQAKEGSSQKFSSSTKRFLEASAESRPDSMALSRILRRVVKRVEEDAKFWCSEALHDIIQTAVIPASSCPEFIGLLARRKELPLLSACLSCMRDIPEMSLLQCLQVFLCVDEEELSTSSNHGNQKENSLEDSTMTSSSSSDVISQARRKYVDRVLVQPFTDSFLLDAVKHLPLADVMLLLKYLHTLLVTPIEPEDGDTSQVTMENAVDWTGIVIDAHFAQLVLVPEVRPLLASLKLAVQNQVDFTTELNSVRNLLHHTRNPKAQFHTQPSNSSQSYSIKVLKL